MMQSIVSSLSQKGGLFTKSSSWRSFSKRSQPPQVTKKKKPSALREKHASVGRGIRITPREPFGLTKQQIIQLKQSIEISHQEFFKDWTRNVLTSNDSHVLEVRKKLRQEYAKVLRNMSMEQIGLWGTAKNMLTGYALHTRTEEDGVREDTDEVIVTNAAWCYESMAKKALYDFPAIYSHILDEIFNQNLFGNNEKNYLVESGAISPQLAQALVEQQSNALADVETSVKVRLEASPPSVVGYSSRTIQLVGLGDASPLPKTLSQLHIPGGTVPLDRLPIEYQDTGSVCVHVMVHTHETYTFTHNGKSKSSKLNTPRILTLNGHFGVKMNPSKSSLEALKQELELAAMEDRHYDLFVHDSTRYNKVYPNGNPLNEALGIKWQLVDIDYLVARTRGWIEITSKDGIQIKNRFCYQPPVGHLNYDKEEAVESMETQTDRAMARRLLLFVCGILQPMLMILLAALLLSEGLPESAKALLLENGWSENDIEELEVRLFPSKLVAKVLKKDASEKENASSERGREILEQVGGGG